MKITKAEKIWLTVVVILYCLYNFPGIPAFGDEQGLIIHGLLTVVPLWIATYAGMYIITKKNKLRDGGSESK